MAFYTMERDTERATVIALKRLGFIAIKQTTIVGIPDRLIIGPNGAICFCEFKYGKGRLSNPQKHWRKKIKKLGFTYLVAYDKETTIEWAKAQTKKVPEKG